MRESVLKDKSKALALRIIRLYRYLSDDKKEYVLSKQVLRCGTSVGANIAEAIYGQSDSDFASKLAIAQKEAHETVYWLELLHESGFIDQNAFDSLNNDVIEIQKMLTASVKTVRARIEAKRNSKH